MVRGSDDRACCSDSEDGDEECGCVGTEDANVLMTTFAEVVCNTTRAVGEVAVGEAEELRIGGYVMNSHNLNRVIKRMSTRNTRNEKALLTSGPISAALGRKIVGKSSWI